MSSQESAMSTLNIVQKTRHRKPNRETTTHSTTNIKQPSKQRDATNTTTMRQLELPTEKTIKRQTTTKAAQLHTTLQEKPTNNKNKKINKTSWQKRLKYKSKTAA